MSDPSTTRPQRRLRGSSPSASEPPSAKAVATTASGDDSERLNTTYLETLLGYNARRAALAVIAVFLRQMAPFGLRPVDFSVLTLIAHNPGVTSRQICAALDILPPNLVGMVKSLQNRSLIMRKPHPTDRRAVGLHLTAEGKRLQAEAQATATMLEQKVADAITAEELATLNQLLRKIYLR
jgi:DNA-binding MarR family transcriptional regulator